MSPTEDRLPAPADAAPAADEGIVITLRPGRVPFAAGSGAQTRFVERLALRLDELWRDLGLPGEAPLRVEWAAAAPEPSDGLPFRAAIGAHRCAANRVDGEAFADDPIGLAEAAAATLYWCRARLLTPRRVALLCRDARAAGQGAPIDPDVAARWLRIAVVQGLAVPEALDLLRRAASAGGATTLPDTLLETMFADRRRDEIVIECGRDVYEAVHGGAGDRRLNPPADFSGKLALLRSGMFYELGIKLGGFRVEPSEALDDDQFRFRFGAAAAPPRRGLARGDILVGTPPETLQGLNIRARAAANPANGLPAAIADADAAAQCEQASLVVWDPGGFIVLALSAAVRRHAAGLVHLRSAEHQLRQLNDAFPMSVFNLLERHPVTALLQVLRGLLEEGVSVRDLRTIVEAMIEGAGKGRTELLARARVALGWPLCQRHATDLATLLVLALDAGAERRLGTGGPALDAAETLLLCDALAPHLRPPVGPRPPLLVPPAVRRPLFELLRDEFPGVAVLGHDEVPPGWKVETVATVSTGLA